jgi:ubiquitin-protein ligase
VNPLNIYVIGYFLTRIFHPNIASNGEICVNTLKKDWNPSLGLRHVLTVSSIALLWGLLSPLSFSPLIGFY